MMILDIRLVSLGRLAVYMYRPYQGFYNDRGSNLCIQ